MKFIVITLFPDMFKGFLESSIIGRAIKNEIIDVTFVNLRDYGKGVRKQVDDTPYGGGAGMVLRVDVMSEAIKSAKSQMGDLKYEVVLLTPQGKRLTQSGLGEMSLEDMNYIFVCGHYEGFDERIRFLADRSISIGDYVLTGGELPTMVLIDGMTRLLPGVLGNDKSWKDETHADDGRIEYPQYTKPETWNGESVPKVLLSGNHQEIARWREDMSDQRKNK